MDRTRDRMLRADDLEVERANPEGLRHTPLDRHELSVCLPRVTVLDKRVYQQDYWTVLTIHYPEQLQALNCACRWALYGPEAAGCDCAAVLEYFQVLQDLQKIPPGWLGVGTRKEVPKDACYKAHCKGHYVWVTSDGLPGLTAFTLVLLDICTVQIDSLKAKPSQAKDVITQTGSEENGQISKKKIEITRKATEQDRSDALKDVKVKVTAPGRAARTLPLGLPSAPEAQPARSSRVNYWK